MIPVTLHRRRAALALMAYTDKRPTARTITRLITDLAHLARFYKAHPNTILVKAEHTFGMEEDQEMASLKSAKLSLIAARLEIDRQTVHLLKWIRAVHLEKLDPEVCRVLFPKFARYTSVAAENHAAALNASKLEIFNEVLKGDGVGYIPSTRTGEHISYVRRDNKECTIYLHRSRYKIGNPRQQVNAHPDWYAADLLV